MKCDSKTLQCKVNLKIQLQSMLRANSLLGFLASMLTLMVFRTSNAQSVTPSLTTTTINANSVYSFSIIDTNLQNRDGTITIGFPTGRYTLASLTCTNTNTPSIIYTCSIVNSTNVAITYTRIAFPSSFISISISTIKNPSSKQSLNFTYTFTSSGITYASTFSVSDPLTPDSLTACSVMFSPATTNTQATATYSITTKNTVDSGGSITITYPSNWANSASTSYSPLIFTTTTCTWISGTTLKPALTCDIFGSKISAGSAFNATVNPNSVISFSSSRIRSPPTTMSGYTITISTETSAGNQVDSSSCTVGTINDQTLSMTSTSSFIVGESNSLSLVWYTASPLKSGDVLTLTLPINYMSFTFFDRAQIVYNDSRIAVPSFAAGSSSVQYRYTLSSLFSSDTEIVANSKIQLSNVIVQCLIDVSPRSVSLQISRSGFSIASGTISITPTPNLLTNVVIQSDVKIVSSPMALNITFTTTNPLATNSILRVQIPSSIPLTGSAVSCQLSSSTHQSSMQPSISCTLSSYVVTLNNFLQTPLPSSATLTLIISNAFKNPQTTEPTAAFIISTLSSANSLIDQSSTITYSAQPGSIGSITITPTQFTVIKQNIYTLDYTIIRTIKSGSSIVVRIPSQMSLSSSPSFSYSLNNGAYTTISPTITNSNTLSFAGIINSQLTAGANIKIRFNRLINPNSLAPSSSFSVDVSYNGYPIQSLSTGLTVTMTTMADFRQITRIVASPVNGATSDYTFYIKPLVPIPVGSSFTIQIIDKTSGTNQITFSSTLLCSVQSIPATCSSSGTTATITSSAALTDTTGNTQYKLVVSSMVLARTTKASSDFKITSLTSSGYGVQTLTISSILNIQPNNIQTINVAVLTQPARLNQKVQLRATIKTFNGLDIRNQEYFVIQIPQSFTYVSTTATSLCTTTIFTCTIFNGNNNAIKVMKSASYLTVGLVKDFTVTLNDLLYISPTTFDFTNDYFLVTTYTSDGVVIDDTDVVAVPASKAIFTRTCAGKCSTCTSNTSFCSTCYVANTGQIPNISYGGFTMMTSDNQCVDACGSGYYSGTGTCIRCTAPCQNCLSASVCTSCASIYYYASTNPTTNRCVSSCPTGTYANTATSTCQTCSVSANCYTCSVIPNNCTSCTGTLYLSGSQCITSCPDGSFENTLNNQCNSCDAGCLTTCGVSATDCTDCKPGYARQSNTSTRCVNTCPSGTVNNTGICECSTTCLTCSGTISNCTSCSGSSFLYGSTCITQCPSQTYRPTNLATCRNCTDVRCSSCNQTTCFTCSSTSYLFSGSCYTTCPNGTRIEGTSCVLCPTGCRSCLSATSCSSCFSGFLTQGSSCVTTCSGGFVNFNATSCLSSCPVGYYNNSGRCQVNINNNTNSTTVVTQNTTSIGRIIPFPYTIAYVLIIGVSIGMRCLYPNTLLPSVMMSLGSVLETMSAITLVIVGVIELSSLVAGIAVVLVAVLLIYVCNFVSLALIIKVLHNDTKFFQNYKKKVCPNIVVRVISVLTYHKFHEIVFSNIFGIKLFCNKVDYVRRLYPFNVLLIISIFLSVTLVVGASLVGYSVQESLLSSSTFIQSVDCILIVVLNVIPTILVLRRKDTLYEQDIDDKQAKRYETQDQLNMNNQSVGIEEVFIEDGGDAYGKPNKVGQSRKNYFYQNSKRSQSGQDPYQTPLDKKRLGSGNPIVGAENQNGQKSSQSLFFGDKSKIKSQIIKPVDQVSEQIEQIVLEEPTRDNLMPKRSPERTANILNIDDRDNQLINYTGYDLDPKLLQLPENSEQFKKLPSDTKAKIRLAKANNQINKNSQNVNKNRVVDTIEVEQIQLSPKKKGEDARRNSIGDELQNSQKDLLDDSLRKQMSSQNQSSPKSKKKSKSKSKSKQKSLSKQKKNKGRDKDKDNQKNNDKRYADGSKKQEQKEETADEVRLLRNQSEQIKKKELNQTNSGIKTTKSQHIKKKKKNPNTEIKVVYNGGQNNQANQKQLEINNQNEEYEEDEPTLPVFKHKSKSKGKRQEKIFDSQSDGLDHESKNHLGKLSSRKSENLEDNNLKNLRAIRGERTIPNQQPDELPQLHSSEQLGNLVVVNRKLKKMKSGDIEFSNDDSSIYKKIYNDETETLKSVQGDNLFGQEVSPSQFNVQNQRFEDTSADNDMPVPATFEDLDEGEQKNNDGFQDFAQIKRYQSSHNIDYDSVLSKRVNNDRIKQLQKIYLPRLDVARPKRKKK